MVYPSFNTVPALMLSGSSMTLRFIFARSRHLSLSPSIRWAISERLSPDFTVYVREAALGFLASAFPSEPVVLAATAVFRSAEFDGVRGAAAGGALGLPVSVSSVGMIRRRPARS